MPEIRHFLPDDWPGIWPMLEPVFRAGETYAVPTDINEDDAFTFWVEKPDCTYVVLDDDETYLGTYFLKTNAPGPGSHVCNCGYLVAENARGRGLTDLMCQHSMEEAKRMGYRAMQYNLVVSTNLGAIKVWERNGFEVTGTLPGAFEHPEFGFVDAHVMYRWLS